MKVTDQEEIEPPTKNDFIEFIQATKNQSLDQNGITAEISKFGREELQRCGEGYQCGFRNNRTVIDETFTLKQIQDIACRYKDHLYVLLIDFKHQQELTL